MHFSLTIPVHEGKKISWRGERGSVEASDLGDKVSSRVWNDSEDVGFRVRSHRTGREMLFLLNDTHYSTEGEIIAWVYVNYGRFGLGSGAVQVTVFND